MKGFGERWIMWMEGCIDDPFFSILVNETSKRFFKSSRGLRWREPLSHFLFSLVADGLSAIFRKAEQNLIVEGFIIGDDKIMVSHFQFADDTC